MNWTEICNDSKNGGEILKTWAMLGRKETVGDFWRSKHVWNQQTVVQPSTMRELKENTVILRQWGNQTQQKQIYQWFLTNTGRD